MLILTLVNIFNHTPRLLFWSVHLLLLLSCQTLCRSILRLFSQRVTRYFPFKASCCCIGGPSLKAAVVASVEKGYYVFLLIADPWYIVSLLPLIENCYLPPSKGPCFAEQQRWYYDNINGECRDFIYGGCQGNGNRFPTKEKCEMVCKLAQKGYFGLTRLRRTLSISQLICPLNVIRL